MGVRILIVEDDKHIRQILVTLLKRELTAASPEIVLARDGQEGLDEIDKGTFDLVISDLLMPRVDGFTFCRQLRTREHAKQVPLIVTSALYRDPATLNKLQADTGAHFFTKPFQVRDLMVMVRRLLAGADKRGAAPRPAAPDPRSDPPDAPPTQTASGSLAERPPPGLLLDLHEERFTGTLVLERARVHKEIVFVQGTPVSARSNLRTETLGHFLVANGVIDEERHRAALAEAAGSGARLGQILVEQGVLTEPELLRQMVAQARARIISLLRWTEGTWLCHPDTPSSEVQTPLPLPRLVFSGLLRTAHVDEIARTLARARGRLQLLPRAQRLADDFNRVFGGDLLQAMAGAPLVEELMAGQQPAALLAQLDALLSCNMVELRPVEPAREDAAPPAAPAAAPAAAPTEGPFDPGVPPAPAPMPAEQRSLYDELFGDEPSMVREGERAEGEVEVETSFDLDELPEEDDEAPPAELALRREVIAEYLAITGKPPAEVLRVAPDAPREAIDAAYHALAERFRLERFGESDLGRDYGRLEEIQQIHRAAWEALRDAGGRAEAQAADAARRAALEADLKAREAQAALDAGEAAAACVLLEEAVARAPHQSDYHALLGWAVFVANSGDPAEAARRAWGPIEQALAIDPDGAEANERAGRILAAAGDAERAAEHLGRALDAQPARGEALALLTRLHAERGAWRKLERQYRKLIHRLGEQGDPRLVRDLWQRLAELYERELRDDEAARISWEVLARLAPDDAQPRLALARLLGRAAPPGVDPTAALREALRLQPDAETGTRLFTLHRDAGRWESALAAAAVLVARGLDAPEAAELWRRHAPRFLPRGDRLGEAELAEIAGEGYDRDFARLFALLLAALPNDGAPPAGAPIEAPAEAPLGRVVRYLAASLEADAPRLYTVEGPPAVRLGAGGPAACLPASLAAAEDPIDLCLALAPLFVPLRRARDVMPPLPRQTLRRWLLAAIHFTRPDVSLPDPDGQLAALAAALGAAPPPLADEVRTLTARLLERHAGRVDLGRAVIAEAHAARRVALCLAGDPVRAARLHAADPATTTDLLDFCLSPEYAKIRTRLGLSLVV